jgi:5'-AMP-activated protein kinase catalytic alpha subunit
MEYCPKGELFNHIVEQQHFNEENSAYYYYQLISGVDYIHSKNICHRDLKPENLLLNEDNELKIIDFGLSNFYFGEEKLLRTPCGSPCYASPEMILGKDYDGYCIDIWSSGIILYAMLCGYLPFEEGDDTMHNSLLFKNIVECKVEYPEEFISPIAKDLLQKIIVREPKNRITIKQIKKHPFFLLGKEIYDKKFNCARNNNTIDYTYESHRIYPSINYNNKNFGGKYKHKFINNINNNHHKLEEIKINISDIDVKENNGNKEYNNYNNKYIKTNYERNDYKNIMNNDDILNSKLLNISSYNMNNKNQITDINDAYFNIKGGNFIHKKNNNSVKNRFNLNINNSLNENSKNGNYIQNKNYYLNNMTLETKLNKNKKKIMENEIRVKKYIKLNNN